MIWFITALIVASAIFMFGPTTSPISSSSPSTNITGQWLLFLLPFILLISMTIALLSGYASFHALTAISFALTGCCVAMPHLHRFIIPCAGLTALTLAAMLIRLL
ncbi:hypothetical protein LZP69_02435 [Shewanella sp. AS1]|uniref:hypothetical protein n=1 Tax=Shewanella sp. AS1 TaxID=2907626 RepID=UPI001F20D7B5|nr:hypothetical protein [Shewanella sp. AS1]MCE9678051.1 hypothetical protein [Shewanella sp. AS1]